MRRIFSLAVVAALASLVGMGVGAAPAAATGSTPGTYTNYGFDTPELTDVTFGVTVASDPGRGNVYWSSQFGFTNGLGGYVGMQRFRNGGGMFLFSVWDATAGRAGDTGTYCQRFTEGGSGYTCRVDRAFTAGHHYTYQVAPAGAGWYAATITDTTAGTTFVLGSLQIGDGQISTGGMVNWVEYFDWNNDAATCADEPYSEALFDLPHGTAAGGGTATATISGTSVSSACADQSSVTARSDGSLHRDAIGNSASGSVTGIDGQCVDISGGSSADGTALELWHCTGGNNQNWVHAADGSLHAQFKCMTATGTDNGAAVTLSTCDGSAGQQWTADSGTLVNPASGRCLDAAGGASADGTGLELWDCTGAANQQWALPA